jgi:ATP-dependent RNA helicase DHX57
MTTADTAVQNFISLATIREITTLRNDFVLSLADLGFIPLSSTPSTSYLNTNSDNTNLLKAVILGGLWPRVARVHLPRSAIKFDRVQAGTIQRENTAREFKIFDLREGRVFLHPASVLFGAAAWKSPFLVYFHKYMSTKVFLRDATEVCLLCSSHLCFFDRVTPGSLICPPIVRWAGVYQSHRRWDYYCHQRRLD